MARSFLSSIPPVTKRLLIATTVATVGCVVARNAGWYQVLDAFELQPGEVIPGLRVWKVLSYAFVTGLNPLSFVFDLLVLFFFGGWFERFFGPRRYVRFFLASAAGAGFVAVLVGLVSPRVAAYPYIGAWPIFEALTVAMGVLQPTAQVYFNFLIPISARQLMFLSWALIVLFALFDHDFVPYITAVGGIVMGFALTVGARGPRRLWLRFQAARLEQKLRRRAQHLRVVPPDGSSESREEEDKKTYLH